MKCNMSASAEPHNTGLGIPCIIRRILLCLFTAIFLALFALVLIINTLFNGPSPTIRRAFTMSLIEASATKWVPALFIGEDAVAEIRAGVNAELSANVTDTAQVLIHSDGAIADISDEWTDYPDGIRFETVSGETYNAHVMIVRDPSTVYMGTSTEEFSPEIAGKRINYAIEDEGAVAGVNAGAFFDNGTSDIIVGSYPLGLVVSENKTVWTEGAQPGLEGFAGFDQNNVLIVSKNNLSKEDAEELGIRDGCCFGPVLILNSEINMEAYNVNSGFNPRTAIGQRSDGAVVFVCIDGRQPGSMGGTYADIINIMVDYGAVNACNMDGGSSTVMMYRDTTGRYGEAGKLLMMNNYSLLQSEPRRMPNFWLVRASEQER